MPVNIDSIPLTADSLPEKILQELHHHMEHDAPAWYQMGYTKWAILIAIVVLCISVIYLLIKRGGKILDAIITINNNKDGTINSKKWETFCGFYLVLSLTAAYVLRRLTFDNFTATEFGISITPLLTYIGYGKYRLFKDKQIDKIDDKKTTDPI